MHSNTATRRLVHKELLVGSIHLGEVSHIRQENVDLDDLGDVRARGAQDRGDVVAAGLGEFADVAGHQGAGGVGGDLAGDEDLAVGADGLGLYVKKGEILVGFWDWV